MPARLCLTDHGSRRSRQPGQGRRAPSTTKVAVPGHILRGEQQDRRGPGDRLRQSLDGPRNSGLRHAQNNLPVRTTPPRTHPFRTIALILAPESSVLVRKAQCYGADILESPAAIRTGPGSADTPRPPQNNLR